MRSKFLFLITTFLVLSFTLPVFSQSKENGAILGKVTDEDGAPLPGVLVTVSSPAVIGGSRTATSDNDGNYRVPLLPPGLYEVKTELNGFQTVIRKEVRLYVGAAFTVNVSMAPKLTEILEVTGEAPLIDSTTPATSYTLPVESLENAPKSSFALDMFTATPGVGTDYTAYGAGGSSANGYWFDGVDVSDPEQGSPWMFPNYNWIQEVQVVGIGAPAEYGGFTGVVANSISRSGSNDFHGLAETFYQNDSLTGDNTGSLSPELQESLQPPSVHLFTDTTAQIGGPIQKDKLWFFAGMQYFYREDQPLGAEGLVTDKEPRAIGKLTYRVNDNNTIQGFLEWDRYDLTGRGFTSINPLETTVTESAPEYSWNFTMDSVLSSNTIFSGKFGGFWGYYYLDPLNGDIPGHFNSNTGMYETNSYYTYHADRQRNQVNAAISHYARDFIKGNHDFKFGVEFERSKTHSLYKYSGGIYYYDYTGYGYYGYYYNGPYLRTINEGYDVDTRTHRTSTFAQDSWAVTDKVRVDIGVRWDHNRGILARTGEAVFKTDPISPRLGFTFDLKGNNKTVIKGHYGHYYERPFSTFYSQLDVYHDRIQQFFFPPTNEWITYALTQHIYSIDSDIKHPYVEQFTIGLDQELPGEIAFGAHFIHRKWKNIIEDVNITGQFEPVTVTNPLTGQPITVFNQLNPGENEFIMTNPDESTCSFCYLPEKHYNGLELFANKRVTNKLYFSGSFVYSKAEGNYDNRSFSTSTGGNNGGYSNLFDDPNYGINTEGHLTNDPTYEFKFSGSYLGLPGGFNSSVSFRYATGDAYTNRWTEFSLDQGRVLIFGLPRGSLRIDSDINVDLRVEKEFPVGPGGLKFTADIFNLFNRGYATSFNTNQSSSTFEQPLAFSDPRFFRLGVRYKF